MAWGVFYQPKIDEDADQRPFVKQFDPQQRWTSPPSMSNPANIPTVSAPHAARQKQRPSSLPSSTSATMAPAAGPTFRKPLSAALLSDPAFSADPRTHPQFMLRNAASFKCSPSPPPKDGSSMLSPLPHHHQLASLHRHSLFRADSTASTSAISSSDSSDSCASASLFTSPSISSASSHSSHSHSPVSSPSPHLASLDNLAPQSVSEPAPAPPPTYDEQDRPAAAPSQRISPAKTTLFRAISALRMRDAMKARTATLSRSAASSPAPAAAPAPPPARLTGNARAGLARRPMRPRIPNPHTLDRIDELDESDPFGGAWHNSGPYDGVASNLAEPHKYTDDPVSKPEPQRPQQPEAAAPHAPSKTPRVKPSQPPRRSQPPPMVQHSNPLSLNLQPGQFLPRISPYPSIPTPLASHLDMPVTQPNYVRNNHAPSRPDIPRLRQQHSRNSIPRVSQPSIDGQGYTIDGFRNPGFPSPSPPFTPPENVRNDQMYTHHDARLPPRQERYAQAQSAMSQAMFQNFVQQQQQQQPYPNMPMSMHMPMMSYPSFAQPAFNMNMNATMPREPRRGPDIPRLNSIRSQSSDSTHSTHSTHTSSSVPSSQSHSSESGHTSVSSASSVHSQTSLQPPKQHVPRRLVMPAPLQQQQQPPQMQYPFSDRGPFDSYAFTEQSAVPRAQEIPIAPADSRRRLRKKTHSESVDSAHFPTDMPLPSHVPHSLSNPPSIYSSASSMKSQESVKYKEREDHRRRLSKRRHDL